MQTSVAFVPKLVSTLREGYTRAQFGQDVTAGIVVGIVALPLAIAFAIASGVSPERGLHTAIVAGFLVSALGGSRVQIGGPTGAFIVVVYGVVQQFGINGLIIATMMAGVILIVLGLTRLGAAIKFIPHPVITGFTSGIAVIILSSQIKDLLGLRMGPVPVEFAQKWRSYLAHSADVNPYAVLVSGVAIAILLLWPRIRTRVPGPLVALVACTALVQLAGLPVETIATRFGGIRAGVPHLAFPDVTIAQTIALVGPAFTIAMLAAIESLLSAVVADGMIGGRHRSNMELVAQGVANVASSLFGGIPATGAIARTATNVKNGGRTPVAGIVHAITLLLISLFLGHWAGLIPLAVLAVILVFVAYHMSEWRTFRAELRSPKSDVAVLLATFLLTVLVDLTLAIEVGMVASAFLFMRRMAEVTNVSMVTREFSDEMDSEDKDPDAVRGRSIPSAVEVYEINGPFFFGAAEAFRDTLGRIAAKPRVLIIRMRHVPAIDSTGMNALRDLVRRSRKDGTVVLLSDVHAQPMIALGRSAALDEIGDENMLGNIDDALNRAREILGLPPEPPPPFVQPTVPRDAHGEPGSR